MRDLLKNGYKAMKRPSGHDISDKFNTDNGAAIPPNLIALANTESNSGYLRYCKEKAIKPHPARYPAALPEYFIRMLTDPGDLVVDPFAGSCVTGEVCERLQRQWVCCELVEEYVQGAIGRFTSIPPARQRVLDVEIDLEDDANHYKVPLPGLLWNGHVTESLHPDGGQSRRSTKK
jgi:site-specific DNA-methyltransferase (cytosine-N4-specific)